MQDSNFPRPYCPIKTTILLLQHISSAYEPHAESPSQVDFQGPQWRCSRDNCNFFLIPTFLVIFCSFHQSNNILAHTLFYICVIYQDEFLKVEMLDQNVYTFLKLSILTDSYNVSSAPMTNFNNYHFMARLVLSVFISTNSSNSMLFLK